MTVKIRETTDSENEQMKSMSRSLVEAFGNVLLKMIVDDKTGWITPSVISSMALNFAARIISALPRQKGEEEAIIERSKTGLEFLMRNEWK